MLQVFEFSLLQKEYTPWSRALLRHGLHRLWLERDTPITHIGFSRRNAAHLLLHDAFMLCVVDQTLPFPEPAAMFHNQLTLRSLPEAERSKFSHAFKICKTFQVRARGPGPERTTLRAPLTAPVVSRLLPQHLLWVGPLDDHSLVVVERPLLDIQSQLPAPVRQKKFAT